MKNNALLKFSKIEDVRRNDMYRGYLKLLAEKNELRSKNYSAKQNRLALK